MPREPIPAEKQDAVSPAPDPAPPERIHAEVWALAWPTIIANVLMNLGSLFNVYFVHFLGVNAMTAVTWGEQVMGLVAAVGMGISVGTTALVARFTGSQQARQASDATRQSLILGMALGFLTTAILAFSGELILRFMGADARTMPLGLSYYRILLWGVMPFFVVNTASAAFRGAGDTRTPVWLLSFMVVSNVVLDRVLIFGDGPFPALGAPGAALASTITRVFGAVLFVLVLWRSPADLLTAGTKWRPDMSWIARIMRIGVPSSVEAFLRTGASATYVGLLGRMPSGPAAVAALSVGLRAEGISFMPGMAFSIAAATLVGQSLGAKDPGHAARATAAAVRQGAAVMSFLGICFFVGAEPIARTLAAPEAVPIAVAYLRIVAISQPFLAMAMTYTGALRGAGDTMRPMWIVILMMWAFRLPPTWYFGLHLGYGANAAWWAMSISTILQGLMLAAAWRCGKWRTARV